MVLNPKITLRQAVAVRFGTQTHPTVVAVRAGDSKATTYESSGLPHQHKLVFSVKAVHSRIPEIAAAEKARPGLNTFRLSYHNESARSFQSGIILIRLDRGLRYAPGNEVLPTNGKITATKDSNGIQTVALALPDGIPSGTQDVMEFQTRYRG